MCIRDSITIRPTSFDPCESSGGSAPIEKAEAGEEFSNTKFIKREEVKSDRPELGTARIVVSGGRGMQSGDNFKLITDSSDNFFDASPQLCPIIIACKSPSI